MITDRPRHAKLIIANPIRQVRAYRPRHIINTDSVSSVSASGHHCACRRSCVALAADLAETRARRQPYHRVRAAADESGNRSSLMRLDGAAPGDFLPLQRKAASALHYLTSSVFAYVSVAARCGRPPGREPTLATSF